MAIAWPMPELPPVTTATLSCSPFMVSSWWGWPHGQIWDGRQLSLP
jgi:hypothetical protein